MMHRQDVEAPPWRIVWRHQADQQAATSPHPGPCPYPYPDPDPNTNSRPVILTSILTLNLTLNPILTMALTSALTLTLALPQLAHNHDLDLTYHDPITLPTTLTQTVTLTLTLTLSYSQAREAAELATYHHRATPQGAAYRTDSGCPGARPPHRLATSQVRGHHTHI